MDFIRKILGLARHDIDAIVAPLNKIIRDLEASAEKHTYLSWKHKDKAAQLSDRATFAAAQAEKAKGIAAKVTALIA